MLFESIKPVLGRSKSLTFCIRGNVLQNFYWYHFSTFICPLCFRALITFYRRGGVTFSDSAALMAWERCWCTPRSSRANTLECRSLCPCDVYKPPESFCAGPCPGIRGFISLSLPTGVSTSAAESAVSSKAPINHCNIWNEIPTAELIWKAVTCWWTEAHVTKIDQLHKLSIAL